MNDSFSRLARLLRAGGADMAGADEARTWRWPCGTGLRRGPRELLAPHIVADVLVFVLCVQFHSVMAAGGYP